MTDTPQLDLKRDTEEAWARYLDSDAVDLENRELLTAIDVFRSVFQAGLAYGYIKAQKHALEILTGKRND